MRLGGGAKSELDDFPQPGQLADLRSEDWRSAMANRVSSLASVAESFQSRAVGSPERPADSGSDCASTQTDLGRKGRCQETSRYANPPETAQKSVHSNHSFIVIGRAQNQHTSLPPSWN